MAGRTNGRLWKRALPMTMLAALALAGCDENGKFSLSKSGSGADTAAAANAPGQSVQLVERDVEAPNVFQVTAEGLWDGRPSLGGVWVAHPDVTDPERVIIRNQSNGKFVIGALFRRERDNPGPPLQVSSDAADALGMLAGAPAELSVTALRREEAPAPTPAATTDFNAPTDVAAAPLDPIAGAAAAIDAAEAGNTESAPVPAPGPTMAPGAITASTLAPAPGAEAAAPAAPAAPAASPLSKPFIQIGIFSVEDNANRTAAQMRAAGLTPTVTRQESQGRAFFRVIIGPAPSEAERARILAKVKGLGFTDAYFVTN